MRKPDSPMNPADLAPALQSIALRHLFTLEVRVDALQDIGAWPDVRRRVGPISSGRFDGERLSGRILPGGSDWQTLSDDGGVYLDARVMLETEVGEAIGMTFGGVRRGPPEVMARLARGEAVDPEEYYFRIHAAFNTAASGLKWLNQTIAVGAGHRLPSGPVYNLFEVL